MRHDCMTLFFCDCPRACSRLAMNISSHSICHPGKNCVVESSNSHGPQGSLNICCKFCHCIQSHCSSTWRVGEMCYSLFFLKPPVFFSMLRRLGGRVWDGHVKGTAKEGNGSCKLKSISDTFLPSAKNLDIPGGVGQNTARGTENSLQLFDGISGWSRFSTKTKTSVTYFSFCFGRLKKCDKPCWSGRSRNLRKRRKRPKQICGERLGARLTQSDRWDVTSSLGLPRPKPSVSDGRRKRRTRRINESRRCLKQWVDWDWLTSWKNELEHHIHHQYKVVFRLVRNKMNALMLGGSMIYVDSTRSLLTTLKLHALMSLKVVSG